MLFLALAVQGRGYENLLKAVAILGPRTERGPSRTVARAAVTVLALIAALILTSGIFGEINAVYALYQQQASSGTAHDVLFSVIVFILATVAGPAITFFTKIIPEPSRADTPPDAKAQAETGKTDPGPDQK